jgi:hypothetical protein
MKFTDITALRIGQYVINHADKVFLDDILIKIDSNTEINWIVKPPLEFIFSVLCREYNFNESEVVGKTRVSDSVFIRQTFAFLTVKIFNPELIETIKQDGYYSTKMKTGLRDKIAGIINRDPTTVSTSLIKVCNLCEVDKSVREKMTYFEELVYYEWISSKQFSETKFKYFHQ